jgi:hypothetical protein
MAAATPRHDPAQKLLVTGNHQEHIKCSIDTWPPCAAIGCSNTCIIMSVRLISSIQATFLLACFVQRAYAIKACDCSSNNITMCNVFRAANICLAKCYAGIPRDVLHEYAPPENHNAAFRHWLNAASHGDPEAMHFVAQVRGGSAMPRRVFLGAQGSHATSEASHDVHPSVGLA